MAAPSIRVELPALTPSDPPEVVEQEWSCVTDQPSRAYGRVENDGGDAPLLHDYAVLSADTLARLGGNPARIKVTLEVITDAPLPDRQWALRAEDGTTCYTSEETALAVAAGNSGYTLGVDRSPVVVAMVRQRGTEGWTVL